MNKSTPARPAGQGAPDSRVAVVITIEPDGFLAAYAPAHVDLRFVQILETHAAEDRTLAENHAARALPAPHREVAFDARCSRASYMPRRPITAESEFDRAVNLWLVRQLRTARETWDPRPVAIQRAHRHAVETRKRARRAGA